MISKITPQDFFEQNKFDLTLDFDSGDYAQLMQDRLLVFNPSVVELPSSIAPAFPKDEKRVGPSRLGCRAHIAKTVRVKLPAGLHR